MRGAEATAMQQKLGSGADAGKNAVSNEEMEKLKAALKAKDEALGGMKKQMELMGTSQLQEARDEFESEKARALDEMEKRHAEKMGEMSAALQAKDADASSIRNKLEEAEKSTWHLEALGWLSYGGCCSTSRFHGFWLEQLSLHESSCFVWCFFYVWFLHDDAQYDLTLTLLFVNGFNIFQGAIQQREKISTSAQKAAKEAEARVSAEILKMKQQLSDKDRELNVSGGWGGGSVFFFFSSFFRTHTRFIHGSVAFGWK